MQKDNELNAYRNSFAAINNPQNSSYRGNNRYTRGNGNAGPRGASAARGARGFNRGTSNYRGNQRAAPTAGNARFPTPAFPNRMDFCFYHRMFGKDARNHELPCAWVYPQQK